MGDPPVRPVHTVGTIRQHNLVMAGITTSESMAGEQPKDEGLGSRVDELNAEVNKLRNELSEFQNYVTVWRSELTKYVLDKLEAPEKTNDGR